MTSLPTIRSCIVATLLCGCGGDPVNPSQGDTNGPSGDTPQRGDSTPPAGDLDSSGDAIPKGDAAVVTVTCSSCHGSARNAAPPTSVGGATDPTDTGVGAHQAHLGASVWRAQVTCDACHLVPVTVEEAGHIDTALPAEITWGSRALADAATPSWDGMSCTNVYCHGATISGGVLTEPTWADTGIPQAFCGSCHGVPPPSPHPQGGVCADCHPTIDAGLSFLDPERHINGVVDVAGTLGCDSCHGSNGQPAPPLDTLGNADTTFTGVGAHRSHLGASDWHSEVECSACHIVPAIIDAPGHRDSALPAELSWGAIASTDGATPSWDGASCTNYCHGQTLSDGLNSMPTWTVVNGTQAFCGSCHGLPPGPPHPMNGTCSTCHPTINDAFEFLEPSRHIDGIVDVVGALACDACHGSGGEPAPPFDTLGNSDTALTGVGAHREHLGVSNWHSEVACSDCHTVPSDVADPGHIDASLPADLTWGARASADGVTPNWDGTSCNVYCHGASLGGGSNPSPTWTVVDGTEAVCGSCHSLPPPAPHPPASNCFACHPTVDAGLMFIDPTSHINGIVDVNAGVSCDACHGGGGFAAPPLDTLGNSTTSADGVGAHRGHLGPSNWHREIVCAECHVVPADISDAGHIDSGLPAEITWGLVASSDGVSPTWNGASCDVYCHGASLNGGLNQNPTWTVVDGSQAFCGSCHSLPPGGGHPQSSNCSICHGATVDAALSFVDATLHINGVVDVVAIHPPGWVQRQNHGTAFNDAGPAACTTCHGANLDGGDVGVSCNACHSGWRTDCLLCHGGVDNNTAAPPSGVHQETSPATLSVGAHTSHVEDTTIHAARACTVCHIQPADALAAGHIDGDGRAEVIFDTLNPSANYNLGNGVCSNLYCHGNGWDTLGSADWNTQPTLGCASCHVDETVDEGRDMSGRHRKHIERGYSCDECHVNVVDVNKIIINLNLHVDGTPDVALRLGGSIDPSGDYSCNPACHNSKDWY